MGVKAEGRKLEERIVVPLKRKSASSPTVGIRPLQMLGRRAKDTPALGAGGADEAACHA